MKSRIYLLLLPFIIAGSCRKIIEVDLPDIEMKPVVNCLFSEGEPFNVHLSFPKSSTDTTIYNIADAGVFIKKGQDETTQLLYEGDGYYSNLGLIPDAGILYSITVSVPGYPLLTACDSIPSANLKVLSYRTRTGIDYEEDMDIPYSRIDIMFLASTSALINS